MMKMTLANLNAADEAGFMAALGDVYEHAPWVAQAALKQRPFATLVALHAAMMDAVRAAPPEQRLTLIKGHPDLAGKAARAGTMTVESKAEQASAGLDRLSEAEFAQFHRLNDAYREKFGMPFIICVRRHSKDSNAGCKTPCRRKSKRRLAKSSASPRFASTNASKPPTASRCTAVCRPMCSIPRPDVLRLESRSSFSNYPPMASSV